MPACQCSEARRPLWADLPAGSNERPRQWYVWTRNANHSAFNGYRRTWSPYSLVECRCCSALWRTKAAFVDRLADCEFAGTGQYAPRVPAIEEIERG